MSHFSNNLSILRRRAGYTQEGLAEALGVSRQAVGKWEGGQTLPEAATLLTLADLLNCSLDQLMREELTEESCPSPEPPPLDEEAERYALFEAYDAHMERFAALISGGIFLELLGLAGTIACAALFEETALSALPVLVMTAAAVFLFIFGGIAHSDFQKQYPHVPLYYIEDDVAAFRRSFRLSIAAAVMVVVLDVALLVGAAALFAQDNRMLVLSVAGFMAVLAFATSALVRAGIRSTKFDAAAYAKEATKAASGAEGEDRVSAVIMLTATIVFLVAGAVFQKWHPTWVVFPMGGILCAIVETLRKK